jgi:hypothetical protein
MPTIRAALAFAWALLGCGPPSTPPPTSPAAPPVAGDACSDLSLDDDEASSLALTEAPAGSAREISRVLEDPTHGDRRDALLATARGRAPAGVEIELLDEGRRVRARSADPTLARVGCAVAREEADRRLREAAVAAAAFLDEQVARLDAETEVRRAALRAFEAEHGGRDEREARAARIAAEIDALGPTRRAARARTRLEEERLALNLRELEGTRLERELQSSEEIAVSVRANHGVVREQARGGWSADCTVPFDCGAPER